MVIKGRRCRGRWCGDQGVVQLSYPDSLVFLCHEGLHNINGRDKTLVFIALLFPTSRRILQFLPFTRATTGVN